MHTAGEKLCAGTHFESGVLDGEVCMQVQIAPQGGREQGVNA